MTRKMIFWKKTPAQKRIAHELGTTWNCPVAEKSGFDFSEPVLSSMLIGWKPFKLHSNAKEVTFVWWEGGRWNTKIVDNAPQVESYNAS